MCNMEQHFKHIWDTLADDKVLFGQFQIQNVTNNSYAMSFDAHITMLKLMVGQLHNTPCSFSICIK